MWASGMTPEQSGQRTRRQAFEKPWFLLRASHRNHNVSFMMSRFPKTKKQKKIPKVLEILLVGGLIGVVLSFKKKRRTRARRARTLAHSSRMKLFRSVFVCPCAKSRWGTRGAGGAQSTAPHKSRKVRHRPLGFKWGIRVKPCICMRLAWSQCKAKAVRRPWSQQVGSQPDMRVHSSVVRAADCRSAGPWFKSGCAL